MSFIAQGVTGASRVITDQPTSNNCVGPTNGLEDVHNAGGWIPAIERAILKLSHTSRDTPVDESTVVIQPSAPPGDAPPSYDTLYPENDTQIFDSSISRSFQSNAWRHFVINGKQIFRDLNSTDYKMLEDAVNTPDASIYAFKIALDVAEDQACSSLYEFLKIFAFVKNYLAFKSEKQEKTVLPESEVRQTGRYEPAVMSQVDAAPPQSRHPDPMSDPMCCWLWFMHAPPTQGDACPCCLCCLNCCGDTTEANTRPNNTGGGGDCSGCFCCDDNTECPDCDCGDCDCGGCDCDCGGCDCNF